MFNWAEDNVIRERLYVPKDKQKGLELLSQDPPGRAGRRKRTRLRLT